MEEIWKDISGYEGLYQVSNLGRVMNVKNGRILNGYKRKSKHSGHVIDVRRIVSLTTGKYTSKQEYIYRLVAKSFSEICGEWFEGCEIDHIDGNPMNDAAENLRVVDHKTNMNNPVTVKRCKSQEFYPGRPKKQVIQYDLDGNFVKEYGSVTECMNESNPKVWECLSGKKKTYKGYIWKYKE